MPPSATKSTPKGKQVLEKIFGLPHPFFDGGSFPTKREAAAMWMWFVENGDFESESKKAKKRKMSPKEKTRTNLAIRQVASSLMVKWRYLDPNILVNPKNVRELVRKFIQKEVEPLKGKTYLLEDPVKLAGLKNYFEVIFDIEPKYIAEKSVEDEDSEEHDDENADPNFEPDFDLQAHRNYGYYAQFIEMCLRYGLSDEAVSNILNSYLLDIGVTDPSHLVSTSKITRMKKKHLLHLRSINDLKVKFLSFGFDGKKSHTKVDRGQKKVQDKIAVIDQVTKTFVASFTPNDGKGCTIANAIIELAKKHDSMDSLRMLSVDGENKNTGHTNGVIRCVENMLKRPVHWLVCNLHLVELVFRHLFIAVDGVLEGPQDYSGDIGEVVSGKDGLVKSPMVNFEPIDGWVLETYAKLCQNNDVDILHRYSLLVQKGPEADAYLKISDCKPGKVTASRWVTTASNVLCLYIQTEEPSENLILLVKIVLRIYAPMLFEIKKNCQFYMGSLQFFNLIKFSRHLLEEDHTDLLDVVYDTLKQNAYYAHPEHILTGMVFDENPDVNKKAITIIQNIRKTKVRKNFVRRFMKPKEINFQAQSYQELVDVKHFNSEPPVLKDYTIEDLRSKNFSQDLLQVPSHSQHVERFVYLTTQAGQAVIGQEARDGWVLNKAESASKIPSKSTKGDWVNLLDEKERVKRNLFTEKK